MIEMDDPELSFSDRWSRVTKLWERDCDVAWICVPSKDAQKQLAQTSLSHARTIWARVGMGRIISIETSKRQNGGRFKFRGICFHLARIKRKLRKN